MLRGDRPHRDKPSTSLGRMNTRDVGGIGGIDGFCFTYAHV